MNKVVKAILFDLDGTLLLMDNQRFIDQYLKLLSAYFKDYFTPEEFIRRIRYATVAMIGNVDCSTTNEQVFKEKFFEQGNITEQQIMFLFEQFYREEYPKLQQLTTSSRLVPFIVNHAIKKGMLLAVATNPVFPRVAIQQRLAWAGLKGSDFNLITSYENMHSCKPKPEYYLEIAGMLAIEPEHCLMVGNDPREDLAAKAVGMKTFLLEDCLISRKNIPLWQPDYQGLMQDLYQLVQGLASVG